MFVLDRRRISGYPSIRENIASSSFSGSSSSRTGFSAEHPSSLSLQPLRRRRRRRRRVNFNHDVEAVAVLLTSKFLPANELTS